MADKKDKPKKIRLMSIEELSSLMKKLEDSNHKNSKYYKHVSDRKEERSNGKS